jgi:hypothetical protein
MSVLPAILVGLHADAVEEGRVDFHVGSLCGRRAPTFKP